MEIEEAKHKRFMELLAAQSEATARFMEQEQVKQQDPQFSYTRRVLALGLTFGTMFAVFLIPVLWPTVPWIVEITTIKSTFLGLFSGTEVNEWIQLYGIPLIFGEAFLHLVAIVTSFYFGNRLGSAKSPY